MYEVTDKDSLSSSVADVACITIASSSDLLKELESVLEGRSDGQYHVSLDPGDVDRVLDDISWTSKVNELAVAIARRISASQFIGLAFVTFLFATFSATFRSDDHPYGKPELRGKAKEQVRRETAVVMRLLFIIKLLLNAAVPIFMAFPFDVNTNPVYIDDLPEFEEVRRSFKRKFIKHRGVYYLMHTTMPSIMDLEIIDFELILKAGEVFKHAQVSKFRQLMTTAEIDGQVDATDHTTQHRQLLHDQLRERLDQLKAARSNLPENDLKKVVQAPVRLRGEVRPSKNEINAMAIGGMRNPRAAVNQLWLHRTVGSKVRTQIESYLDDHPDIVDLIFRAITANDKSLTGPTADDINTCLSYVRKVLDMDDTTSTTLTQLRPSFFEAWLKAAKDPDTHIVDWMCFGTPAGIAEQVPASGIFPPTDSVAEAKRLRDLAVYTEGFSNYVSIEESPHGEGVLNDLVKSGFVKVFPDEQSAISYLEANPVVAKMALISKEKDGVLKHRLILDCRVSGSNERATRNERIVLPRIWDAIRDGLELMLYGEPGHTLDFMVLDFRDAFYMLPLAHAEQRYFSAFYKGRFYVWQRVAQGSLNGPNTFGRLSAAVGRMTAGLLQDHEARLQLYVDDPLLALYAAPRRKRIIIASVVMLWLMMGFDLAYHKGQFGHEVCWVGYDLKATKMGIEASIKADFMKDFSDVTAKLGSKNIISKRALQSYAGKANHISNLLKAWRPFLDCFWAALYNKKTSNAPYGMVWTSQVRPALEWLSCFLAERHGPLRKAWELRSYSQDAANIVFHLDASPYSLAAVLVINGEPWEYFSSPLTKEDTNIHRKRIGDSKGQQIWESLTLLVSLRVWFGYWSCSRCAFTVKSDNTSALVLAATLKSSKSINLIAKEIALLYCEAQYEPRFLEHVPGVMNIAADALSRLNDPASKYVVPDWLSRAKCVSVPLRGRSFYKTLVSSSQQVGEEGS